MGNGAKKLLDQAPLDRLVPVDEYLPIMYDKHDNKELLKHFEPRNLEAYSAEPLLLYPSHYVGQENYISDTEKSGLWEAAKQFAPPGNDGTGFDKPKEEIDKDFEIGSRDHGKIKNPEIDGFEFTRLKQDERFKTENVLKNFEKWEEDFEYLCDNEVMSDDV